MLLCEPTCFHLALVEGGARLGTPLGLSDVTFETWVATAVNDTSAVLAAGYAYSDAAGATATIVKLTRMVLLVPLAVTIGIVYEFRKGGAVWANVHVWRTVPWFVFGFIGAALLNTLGALPQSVVDLSGGAAKFLIVVVLASVGLGMNLGQIRRMGVRPFLIGMLVGGAMGAISLALTAVFAIWT